MWRIKNFISSFNSKNHTQEKIETQWQAADQFDIAYSSDRCFPFGRGNCKSIFKYFGFYKSTMNHAFRFSLIFSHHTEPHLQEKLTSELMSHFDVTCLTKEQFSSNYFNKAELIESLLNALENIEEFGTPNFRQQFYEAIGLEFPAQSEGPFSKPQIS